MKDFGFKTFEKLLETCVYRIMDYGAGILGYKYYKSTDNIQDRYFFWYFLGVHRFAPLLGIHGDVDWSPTVYRRWLAVLRFRNRLIKFDNTRVIRKLFDTDYEICTNNWSSEIKDIVLKLNMLEYLNNKHPVSIEMVCQEIVQYYSNIWAEQVKTVPKQRTYVTFKD